MANYGRISDFKMSMEASGQDASIYHFRIKKTKNQSKKDPLNFQKIKYTYKQASNQNFLLNRPPKSGNFDSKYNFEIFKNQKLN